MFSFLVTIFSAKTIKERILIFSNGSKLKNVSALNKAANNPAYEANAKYLFFFF